MNRHRSRLTHIRRCVFVGGIVGASRCNYITRFQVEYTGHAIKRLWPLRISSCNFLYLPALGEQKISLSEVLNSMDKSQATTARI